MQPGLLLVRLLNAVPLPLFWAAAFFGIWAAGTLGTHLVEKVPGDGTLAWGPAIFTGLVVAMFGSVFVYWIARD